MVQIPLEEVTRKKYYTFWNAKCGEVPMMEKPKLSSDIGLITMKANIELSGKETEKHPRNVFMIIIVWMII